MKQTTRGYARHGNEPRILADIADFVQSLARSLFDPYRPELYYMRGPGPACRAKAVSNVSSGNARRIEPISGHRKLAKARA